MGYACPVCTAEQADAEHLANHFAVTASLGREDHLEWLAEYAPDWNEMNPEQLGEIVAEHAPEIETPEFEEGHDHGRSPNLESEIAAQSQQRGRGSLTHRSEATQNVIAEAQELTQQMYDDEGGSDHGDERRDNESE